jgi:hypothetical protein
MLQIRVFWKNPVWKIFNFENFPKSRMRGFSISKKMEVKVLSFYKYLGLFFYCYLLSTIKKKIYRNVFHGGRKFLHLKIHDPFFELKKTLSSLHWKRTNLEAIQV